MHVSTPKIVGFVMVFLAFMATSLQAETGVPKKGDDFVAKVNTSGISQKDFDRTYNAAQQQFANIGNAPGQNSTVNLKKEVLDRLIDFELMYQDSMNRNIVVDDALLNENFAAFQKQFGKDEDFAKFLETNNISADEMKEQIKRKMAIQSLQQALQPELLAKSTVQDKEVEDFYNENIDKLKQPEQVKASHILIKVDQAADEAAKADARKKMDDILKKIQAGDDFAELARANSQCPSNANGGDLGFFGRGQMVKPFEDAAFGLNPGEVSDIVETQFGFHVIKMEEKKAAATPPFKEMQENIEKYLTQLNLEKAQQNYLQELRDKAKITTLIDLDEQSPSQTN